MKRFCVAIAGLALLVCGQSGLKAGTRQIPVIQVTSVWNMDHMEKIRELVHTGPYAESYEALIHTADSLLGERPLSVMEKKSVPASGDMHDYMSIARYYWPDPSRPDGLPYVNRDGYVNPELFEYDRYPLGQMVDRVVLLTLAWYYSGNEDYAGKAAEQVRTWFLDSKTRMNPNLNYSQVVKGKNGNRGNSSGLIDTYSFIEMLEAVYLLEESRSFTDRDSRQLKEWFSSLTEWMQESPQGRKEAASANNHSISYDAQIIAFAMYSGNLSLARDVAEAFAARRLFVQVEPDGSQPQELRRALAFHYSRENITHFANISLLARRLGLDIDREESPDGRSFYRAVDFLLPYAGKDVSSWPYQQISGWDREMQYFCRDLYRIATSLDPEKRDEYIKCFRSVHKYVPGDRFNLLYWDREVLPVSSGAPKVVLKLDDLYVRGGKCSCTPVLDLLLQRGIPASFGIMAGKCDNSALKGLRPYMDAVSADGDRLFEFWHHGYDHVRPEFGGAPYSHQKSHFEAADSLVNSRLGIQMVTFGAPFNQVDSLTASVIAENGKYKYVFFADEDLFSGTGITVLNNRVNIENGTGKVGFDYFSDNYSSSGAEGRPFIVLQGHPNQWDEARIREFARILDFLEEKGCEFILPSEVSAGNDIYMDGWIDFNKNGRKDVYEDPSRPVDDRVADLLDQMTVEEKTCQLVTLYGFGRVLRDSLPVPGWKNEIWKDGIANIDEQLNGVGPGYRRAYGLIWPFSSHARAINEIQRWFVEETRLGIPVDFSNEGIHGLNHTKATPLPAPVAVGSTWNRDLVRKAGEIAGLEAKALGYTNVYAPILDLARDPRWGRTLECYGEDPYLVSELGAQMVEGIQSQGVASTLKHYAVYSVPKGGRDGECRTDPHVTPRELHEIHLYPFRKVISEAHPMGVMSSYNDWNGEPVSASRYFLTDLLRGEYGFDGYVVSDSDAVEFVHSKHQVADTYEEAVRMVLEAGLNVRTNFSEPSEFVIPLRNLISSGRIPMSVIDRRVSEVLKVKFELGLFDNPYVDDPDRADMVAGAEKHLDFIDDMQLQSLVLLKNDGNLLPLDRKRTSRVLVTGPLADETNFMSSRYGPNGLAGESILDGIRAYLGGDAVVDYCKGCDIVDADWPDSELVPTAMTAEEKRMIRDAASRAKKADVVIAVLGEDEYRVGESRSRTSLELPGRQQQLLEALHASGTPVVLVLVNGQPLTVNWADRNVPAILETWFPGYRGGAAIAKTLWGEYNPGGKLTVTFPKTTGQIELNFPFKKGSHGGQHRSGPNGSGSTRVLGPLYPFGHGLSYTEFAYSDLEVKTGPGKASPVMVSLMLTNTGKMAGDEVVQLYVRDRYSSVVTYDSVLRGFERVSLAPGESRRVSFVLEPEDLQILDSHMEWTVEPGEFEIMVGASSTDIRLSSTILVE